MKAQRFVCGADSHGDMIHAPTARAFLEFVADFKPSIKIHAGDFLDLRALRKGASEEDRQDGLTADVEMGLDFMARYKPTHTLRGNHDERLWDTADRSPNAQLREYCKLLRDRVIDSLGDVPLLPYCKRQGVLRFGSLKIIHGFHSGIYAARQAALVYGSVLMGHTHTIDHAPIPGIERRMGRVIGALCQLDMPYNRAQANTLRQAHGWAYGFIYPNGNYSVYQAEQINGRWMLPTEFRELRA